MDQRRSASRPRGAMLAAGRCETLALSAGLGGGGEQRALHRTSLRRGGERVPPGGLPSAKARGRHPHIDEPGFRKPGLRLRDRRSAGNAAAQQSGILLQLRGQRRLVDDIGDRQASARFSVRKASRKTCARPTRSTASSSSTSGTARCSTRWGRATPSGSRRPG